MKLTSEDVERILGPHVQDGILVLTPTTRVPVQRFAELFADAGPNPDYDSLVAIDGGVMGYMPYLEQWRGEGLI